MEMEYKEYDLHVGDRIILENVETEGDKVYVLITSLEIGKIKIGVKAPRDILILRKELKECQE